jgi:hypothetical protein
MSELSESADLSSAPQIVVKTKQKGSDFLRFASENESDTAQTSSEFKYGVYGETEIELLGLASTADVSWYVSEDTLPPGLELEDSITESVLLFGTPEFQGQWCFVISADTSDIQVDNEICVVAEDNEELLYPRFETDRYLDDGVVGQRYSQKIKLVKQYDDFGQAIRLTGSFENGLIPMGLSLFGSL